MMAALTSAAMPSIVVAGVFTGTTHAHGIDQAQVRDASGTVYDVIKDDNCWLRAYRRRVRSAR